MRHRFGQPGAFYEGGFHEHGGDEIDADPFPSETSFSASGTSSSSGIAAASVPPATGPSVVEVNDAAASSSTAYTIAVGQTAQGRIATTGDHDWYAVNLVAGQTYAFAEIGTGTNALQNTFLYLKTAGGT